VVPKPEGNPSRASMELVWLRGVEAVPVDMLARGVEGRTIRVPDSRMKVNVSSSRLSGRAGRGGGGPARLVKGTMIGFSGTRGLAI
jgi:hypothetical protein